MPGEIERIAAYADRVLPLQSAHLSDDYFYQSLPLCVIDAVYSIGVRYAGVQRVVERYCQTYGLRKTRAVPYDIPPRDEQESISALCEKMERQGVQDFAANVFQNLQRTSTRSGILKAEAVLAFAQVLRAHGVEHLQDIPAAAGDAALEQAIRQIPGQTSGISLQYLWMLAGSDDFIKPDRMILRFLQEAIGRTVTVREAPDLLRAATSQLQSRYPQLTPRVLDHEIWKHQRGQPVAGDAGQDATEATSRVHNEPRTVVLDPDVAAAFDSDEAVNETLRHLIAIARRVVPPQEP